MLTKTLPPFGAFTGEWEGYENAAADGQKGTVPGFEARGILRTRAEDGGFRMTSPARESIALSPNLSHANHTTYHRPSALTKAFRSSEISSKTFYFIDPPQPRRANSCLALQKAIQRWLRCVHPTT
jgi:hypothetical protein